MSQHEGVRGFGSGRSCSLSMATSSCQVSLAVAEGDCRVSQRLADCSRRLVRVQSRYHPVGERSLLSQIAVAWILSPTLPPPFTYVTGILVSYAEGQKTRGTANRSSLSTLPWHRVPWMLQPRSRRGPPCWLSFRREGCSGGSANRHQRKRSSLSGMNEETVPYGPS